MQCQEYWIWPYKDKGIDGHLAIQIFATEFNTFIELIPIFPIYGLEKSNIADIKPVLNLISIKLTDIHSCLSSIWYV